MSPADNLRRVSQLERIILERDFGPFLGSVLSMIPAHKRFPERVQGLVGTFGDLWGFVVFPEACGGTAIHRNTLGHPRDTQVHRNTPGTQEKYTKIPAQSRAGGIKTRQVRRFSVCWG